MSFALPFVAESAFVHFSSPLPPPIHRYTGELAVSPTAACNSNCSCSVEDTFLPHCGTDGRTYYSPCYAGCVNGPGGSFVNCSCVAGGGSVKDGICDQKCANLPITAVLFGLAMFCFFANASPALSLIMRTLPPEHVSLGLSAMQMIWKACGSIPGPIIMGALFDANCAFTQPSCSTSGGCVLYRNANLALSYSLLAILGKAMATLCFFFAFLAYNSHHKRHTRAVEESQRTGVSNAKVALETFEVNDGVGGTSFLPFTPVLPNVMTATTPGLSPESPYDFTPKPPRAASPVDPM